jgi:hypothetical protein
MPDQLQTLVAELRDSTPACIARVKSLLPKGFPANVADPIFKGLRACMNTLSARPISS